MAKLIPLTQGYSAVVDDEDYDRLSQQSWHAAVTSTNVYAVRNRTIRRGIRRQFSLHQAVLSTCGAGMTVDHINRDGLNCRRSNLRCATRRQQILNTRPRSQSGFKGAWLRKRSGSRPWKSEIIYMDRRFFLGSFATAEEAARAYDVKARELFGEFAFLNFPDEAIDAAA